MFRKYRELKDSMIYFWNAPFRVKLLFLLFVFCAASIGFYWKAPDKAMFLYELAIGVRPEPSKVSKCENVFWNDMRGKKFSDGRTPVALVDGSLPTELENNDDTVFGSAKCLMSIVFDDGNQEEWIATRYIENLTVMIDLSSPK